MNLLGHHGLRQQSDECNVEHSWISTTEDTEDAEKVRLMPLCPLCSPW